MAWKNYNAKAEKIAFNQRLHAEGRWDEYFNLREDLKRQGVSVRQAWKIAAKEFPPLDGSPHELSFSDDISDLPSLPEIPGQPEAESAAEVRGGDDAGEEFFLDGSQWTDPEPAKSATNSASKPAAAKPKAKGKAEPAPEPAAEPVTRNVQYAREVKKTLNSRDEEWANLSAAVDAVKTCGAYESVQWVYDHAGMAYSEIDPNSVPSRGALRMLRWVNLSDANYTEFIRSIWSKTIPAKSQLDLAGRFSDDGRVQLAMLSQFEEEYFGRNPEARPEEPAAEDSQAGEEVDSPP